MCIAASLIVLTGKFIVLPTSGVLLVWMAWRGVKG